MPPQLPLGKLWPPPFGRNLCAEGYGKCDFLEGEIDYRTVAKELVRLHWSGDIACEFWFGEREKEHALLASEQNLVMRYFMKHYISQYRNLFSE